MVDFGHLVKFSVGSWFILDDDRIHVEMASVLAGVGDDLSHCCVMAYYLRWSGEVNSLHYCYQTTVTTRQTTQTTQLYVVLYS